MTAIEALLAGLIDYAGLYAPASLPMQSAVENYLKYKRSTHHWALGRFIVNLERLGEFCDEAGESIGEFKLSVVAAETAEWNHLADRIKSGIPIEAVEIKCNKGAEIRHIADQFPRGLEKYFEVPIDPSDQSVLEEIRSVGARAKIRMGGIVPEAFPSSSAVASMLAVVAEFRLPLKATAGLHHPVRARRSLTYELQGPVGVMHGFLNLCGAAALLFFGGAADQAEKVLNEEDSSAWRLSRDTLQWHDLTWTADQLAALRKRFLTSIGSCSFEEPIHDLESLGWL